MKWFESNPAGASAGFLQEMSWDAHTWGRQAFASNFARGGVSATMFAPTKETAMQAFKSKPLEYGSPQHIKNLEIIQSKHPKDLGIKKALEKAKTSKSLLRGKGRLLQGAMIGAFVAMPLFTTPGDIIDKTRAFGGGLAFQGGMAVGSFVGKAVGSSVAAGLGAAIGTALLPGLGTGLGALAGKGIGWLVGGYAGGALAQGAYEGTLGVMDRAVDRERARRNLNWKHDQTAFMTQGAHTMRQQSLQAMNRGMMNARSMLGREGVMLHQ